jgi:ribonuclease HI
VAWVRARLREQTVYARADERGQLLADGGRVEVRYRPNDGRAYRAGSRNLEIVDPTPLPDDTCGPAEAVSPGGAAARPGAGSPPAATGAPRRARGRGRAAAQAEVLAPAPGEPGAASPDGAAPLVVYTDGACSSNPGPAGLGVVIVRPTERLELSEYLGQGTNNIAELTAVLRALNELDPACPARIHTDSQYTIGVVQRGWKAKANTSLVAELRAALGGHPLARLVYVPGHSGVPLNERCDELARLAIARRRSERTVIATGQARRAASD